MNRHPRAFTLVELLISIAIIAVLASLVIVALTKVRAQAVRTESMNALRNMAAGYNSYSADNGQRLMPGYIDAEMLGRLRISPKLGNGKPVDPAINQGNAADPNDASSYVWRLSPYLDDAWNTMYIDYRYDSLMQQLSDEYASGIYGPGTATSNELGISLIPSFGLNSIYLGGDNVHGGNEVTRRNPWNPDTGVEVLAATRLSEIRNPARLIVFAPSVHYGELDDIPGNDLFTNPAVGGTQFGYAQVTPPVVRFRDDIEAEEYWYADKSGAVITGDFGGGGGVPIARWDRELIPVAHVDGSTDVQSVTTLGRQTQVTSERDLNLILRAWSPWEVGYD